MQYVFNRVSSCIHQRFNLHRFRLVLLVVEVDVLLLSTTSLRRATVISWRMRIETGNNRSDTFFISNNLSNNDILSIKEIAHLINQHTIRL